MGGASGGINHAAMMVLDSYTVAQLNALVIANYKNHVAYCSNGAAGSAILAYCNGTNWLRSDTGGAIAAA